MESIRLNNKSLDPNNKIVVSTNDNPIINHLSPIYNTLVTAVSDQGYRWEGIEEIRELSWVIQGSFMKLEKILDLTLKDFGWNYSMQIGM